MKISELLAEMRDHRDAYERDVQASQSGMGRPHDHRGLSHELAHERNNLAIAINGKTWKVIPGRGYNFIARHFFNIFYDQAVQVLAKIIIFRL